MHWCCPRCRGPLTPAPDQVTCQACAHSYDVVGGVADLRLPGPCWLDPVEDKARARRLVELSRGWSAEALVRHVFSTRENWTDEDTALRSRQVLSATDRLVTELDGWLAPFAAGPDPILDLGCGPGMLLAALARRGRHALGVDVSMEWLVVAHRLVQEAGGEPQLAAAMAEALPVAAGSLGGVVALDVMEHVDDQPRVLAEIDRSLGPGGHLGFSTPNRFSLAAEPHVHVWGVGWLPRGLQKRYVAARTHQSYEHVRLLSVREAARLLERNTRLSFRIEAPPIPAEEIGRFPPRRRFLARTYNRMIRWPALRAPLLHLGPFFRVIASRPA